MDSVAPSALNEDIQGSDETSRQEKNLGHKLTDAATENTLKEQKVQKCEHTRPAIEDYTKDMLGDYQILPNSMQLVLSALPLTEAENLELSGVFLFRQIYPPYDEAWQCLLCRNKCIFSSLNDLGKHYAVIHGLNVSLRVPAFNPDIIPIFQSGTNEECILHLGCAFCDITMNHLSEIRDHFLSAHKMTARVLPESDVAEVGTFFYCSLCGHPSVDFSSHHQHMKDTHRMQLHVCRYCTYYTSEASLLTIHVEVKHVLPQLRQCSVCSVYVHGKDELTKHMLSHTVQTETVTPDDLPKPLKKIAGLGGYVIGEWGST